MASDLQELEAKLGYTFRDRDLLVRALTHRSFSSEASPSRVRPDNEQLEFFGDSVLGFIVSEMLVTRNPALAEGRLSRARSHLVSARWLHQVAQAIGLGEFLQLGRGEELGGGRVKPSLLANALEAVIAALYLDGGIEPARRLVDTWIYTDQVSAGGEADHMNYKGRLWERAGAMKLPHPEYVVIETIGPAHAPSFRVEARLGTKYSGQGHGPSKKSAEQHAARSLLESMDQASVEVDQPAEEPQP